MSEYQIRAIRDGQAFAVEGPGVRPIYMTEGEAMAWQRHLNAAFAAGAASRQVGRRQGMSDIVAVMREMGLWPVHGWCRCGGYGVMTTITKNVAEWRCDRCGMFMASFGPPHEDAAGAPAPPDQREGDSHE